MHVVFRESRGLEETATPRDIGQDPADLVVLSYSDSDLAAFAAGWRRGRDSLPTLRLATLLNCVIRCRWTLMSSGHCRARAAFWCG